MDNRTKQTLARMALEARGIRERPVHPMPAEWTDSEIRAVKDIDDAIKWPRNERWNNHDYNTIAALYWFAYRSEKPLPPKSKWLDFPWDQFVSYLGTGSGDPFFAYLKAMEDMRHD